GLRFVIDAEPRQMRHVAGLTAAIPGPHAQRLRGFRIADNGLRRIYLEALDRWRRAAIVERTLRNPVAKDPVGNASLPKPPPSLVGELGGPLEQHQALFGLEPIDPPSLRFAEERLRIQVVIESAQAEAKAVLSAGSPVTGSRVASRLRERGD